MFRIFAALKLTNMGHVRLQKREGEVYKTYKLKVKSFSGNVDIKAGIVEYDQKFNNVSQWIADHLTSMTIGEAARRISPHKMDSQYAMTSLSDEWKDQPLYKIFTRGFGGMNADNLIIECTKTEENCKYDKEKSLGFSESVFRTFGFAANASSDMKSRMTQAKVKIGRKNIDEDSADEEKCLQAIYEIQKNELLTDDNWKDRIGYLEMKGDQERELERTTILYDYYKANRTTVLDKLDNLKVEMLSKFRGSKRKSDRKILTLNGISYDIKRKEGCQGFELKFSVDKNHMEFDLLGHRALIKNGEMLVDIENCHGSQLSLEIDGDDMYAIISMRTFCEKNESKLEKIIGADVNIKHMFLMTSEKDDGNMKCYVNLYMELLSDSDFTDVLNKEEYEIFSELSKYVMFGLIETPYLGSRVMGTTQHEKIVEDKITSGMKKIATRLFQEGNVRERIYVQNVLKIRALLKALFSTKLAYSNEQKIYDNLMRFGEKDDRRKDEGFHTTCRGTNLRSEMDILSKKILACRDNIVEYGYYVIGLNGFDGISLENLESSTFMDVKISYPSCNSMLDHFKLKGKTIEEAENHETVGKFIKKGYYDMTLVDGKINDIKYSEKAVMLHKKNLLYDTVIKSTHFADVKDKFVELSNNGKVSVVIVPPYFSSQMDSVTHKVFTEEIVVQKKSSNGKVRRTKKTVLVDKRKVRKTQESHINGLNADYNAALNLKYIAETIDWRSTLCFKTWNTYGSPQWDSKIKNQKTMIDRLDSLGAIELKNW